MSIRQNIVLESQTRSVNDGIYDFDWVFPEIPLKNCIVGMLLTYCIVCWIFVCSACEARLNIVRMLFQMSVLPVL